MRRGIYFWWFVLLCTFVAGWSWQNSDTHASDSLQNTMAVDSVAVRIPNVWGMTGDTIAVPVILIDDVTHYQVLSVQLDLKFDPDVISLAGDSVVREGTITEGWAVLFEGALIDTTDMYTFRMVWAAVDSLTGSGPLVYIPFRVLPTVNLGETSPLQLEICFLNEGNPACRVFDGVFTVGEPPRIELSGQSHDFGTVAIGDSADWILRISNVGDNVLDLYSLESDSAQFRVVSPLFPQSIDSGMAIDVTVSFKPNSDDSLKTKLRLSCNDLENLILDIPLRGFGRGTKVLLSNFSAKWQDGQVILRWMTYEEIDHLGFYLYRSRFQSTDYERVSSELITGESSYIFRDRTVTDEVTYYYRLNSVNIKGNEEPVGFTSVRVHHSIPIDYSLSQNFPNPFNPVTYITYGVPGEEYIELTVYNAMGQEVRTLFKGITRSGNHKIKWDGLDNKTRAQPSGIYFCRLQSSKVSVSIRMLLLR